MKKILVALFPLLLVEVSAQHAMHVEVQADRIAIGSDFVPRFLDQPQTFVVVPGASTVLNAGTYGYIEVGGTLTIPAVEVKATHVVVLPGGTLIVECGATIVGRNVPINTERDPFQWGNGLLNFGTLRMVCPEKTPFVPLEGDAGLGAGSLTLVSEPIGWAVGDELVLPDTRQMTNALSPNREVGTTIASISGKTIGLSKPLAFERRSIRRPDGSVVLTPRVANLGRRTVIRSEDPAGVRWHVAQIGLGASWDVQGVALVGLGRTRNERLDSTTADRSHIGTNQIGRYAFHMHHAGSSLSVRRISGSAIAGQNGGKWGVVVHQSHDIEILNNVCVDTPGSCFATEDGNEVRNVFRGNFAAYVKGTGVAITEARSNVANGNPGAESCFWFRGVGNIIDRNEAWNCQSGIDLFNQAHLAQGVAIPSLKGGTPDTTPVLQSLVPSSFKNNVTAANTDAGLEYWTVSRFPAESHISANNASKQVWNGQADGPAEIYLVDAILIASSADQSGASACVASSIGYNTGVETLRGELRGCRLGVGGGIGKVYGRFTETVFQNFANFWFEQGWPPLTLTRVRHEPLGGSAPTYFWTLPDPEWAGGSAPLPNNRGGWGEFDGGNAKIVDWQGTGKNYRLVHPSQSRTALAWRATAWYDWQLPPPECGATLGETWDRCGMAYNGQPFAPGEAVALDGIVNMLAVSEPRPPLGIPHAILTSPNGYAQAMPRPDYGVIVLSFALTGRPADADQNAYFTINGGPRQVVGAHSPGVAFWRTQDYTPGTRTVRTWREQNGKEVPGSSMTFTYVVGDIPLPPPPPPPPPSPTTPPPPPPPPPTTTSPCPTLLLCR